MDRRTEKTIPLILKANVKRTLVDEIAFYEATEYLYNADKLTKREKLTFPFLYRNNFPFPKRILKLYQDYFKGGELN